MTIFLSHMVHELRWQKAVKSANNGACVEVARLGSMIAVRDSKEPKGPALTYNSNEWSAFLDGVKRGEFDHFVGTEPAGAP